MKQPKISVTKEVMDGVYRRRLHEVSLELGLVSILIDKGLTNEAQEKLDDICEWIGIRLKYEE